MCLFPSVYQGCWSKHASRPFCGKDRQVVRFLMCQGTDVSHIGIFSVTFHDTTCLTKQSLNTYLARAWEEACKVSGLEIFGTCLFVEWMPTVHGLSGTSRLRSSVEVKDSLEV